MELMNRRGVTVFLDTPVEQIIGRLSAETSTRPMLKDIPTDELSGFIEDHHEKRRGSYLKASIRIEGGDAEAVAAKLRL
jgi:shikimate kinase